MNARSSRSDRARLADLLAALAIAGDRPARGHIVVARDEVSDPHHAPEADSRSRHAVRP